MFTYCINSINVSSDIELWNKETNNSFCQLYIHRETLTINKNAEIIWEEKIDNVVIQELYINRKDNSLNYYAYHDNGKLCFACKIFKHDMVNILYDYYDIPKETVVYFIYKKIPLSLQYMGFTVLHGSAFTYKDKSIILLGDSGVGKSTLTLKMQLIGAKPLADDYVAIKNGSIYYTNIFSHINKDIFSTFSTAFITETFKEITINSLTGKYIGLFTKETSGIANIDKIFLLHRSKKNHSHLENLDSSDSFTKLLNKSINGIINPAIQFKELVELSKHNIKILNICIKPFDFENVLSIFKD